MLMSSNELAVASWGKHSFRSHTKGIFHYDLLFVPIHLANSHWYLGVVDFKKKRFCLYDSLCEHSPNNMFFSLMRKYIQVHHQVGTGKHRTQYDFSGWTNHPIPVSACPQQKNFFDCGLFLLLIVDQLSRGLPLDFSQGDIDSGNFRKRILFDIYHRDFRHELSLVIHSTA